MAETSIIAFRVDSELHRRLKVYLASSGQSLSEYFVPKIEADLNLEEQNASSQQDIREDLHNCATALQSDIQRLVDILEQQF